jgi:hypothetical protein
MKSKLLGLSKNNKESAILPSSRLEEWLTACPFCLGSSERGDPD